MKKIIFLSAIGLFIILFAIYSIVTNKKTANTEDVQINHIVIDEDLRNKLFYFIEKVDSINLDMDMYMNIPYNVINIHFTIIEDKPIIFLDALPYYEMDDLSGHFIVRDKLVILTKGRNDHFDSYILEENLEKGTPDMNYKQKYPNEIRRLDYIPCDLYEIAEDCNLIPFNPIRGFPSTGNE